MKKIVIAIDGYSSCGKSTFAKTLAAKYGYVFIDTGAMYRAVTLYAIRKGLADGNHINEKAVIDLLNDISVSFRYNEAEHRSNVYLGNENVEPYIRGVEVSSLVSNISAIKEVREFLVEQQRAMGKERGVVMDGRDIGTVVFPDAELKIFMTASPKVRARRRYDELRAKGDNVSLEEIESNIRERDRIDETRKESPLRKADDAIILDNSSITPKEQMVWIEKYIEKYI